MPASTAQKLTKGQAKFMLAVSRGEATEFHRSVIEPCERMGLVRYTYGYRLVGRNAFPASHFALTERGEA